MSLYAHLINDSPVKLWGLTSRQRKLRVLRSAGVTDIVDDLTVLPDNSSALLLRDDYLFDDRVIHYLVQTPDVLLNISQVSMCPTLRLTSLKKRLFMAPKSGCMSSWMNISVNFQAPRLQW